MSTSAALLAAFRLFGLDPSRDPHAVPPDEGEIDRVPVLRWSVRLPGVPPAAASHTEPASVLALGDRLYVGYSGANALLVLDRGSGSLVTRLPTHAPVLSRAWSDGSTLLFSDGAGYTFAYRADGPRWKKAWEHYSGAPVLSTPTVSEGTVYVSNVDDVVYALSLDAGELRWRYGHDLDAARLSDLELYGAPAPSVAGDVVYCGFSDGFLVALGRADGAPRWTREVGEGTYADLIAPAQPVGDAVLVSGFMGPLVHLDAGRDHAPTWRIDVGTAAPALLSAESAYVPGSDGTVRRVDLRTGDVRWTFDTATGGVLGTPVLTPAGLFVASSEGSPAISLFSGESPGGGRPLNLFAPRTEPRPPPRTKPGGALNLLDPDTGALRWTLDLGYAMDGISAPLTAAGRHLYAVTNAGELLDLYAPPSDTALPRDPWVSPRR